VSSGTGKESGEEGASKGTDRGKGTDTDVVPRTGEEKYGTHSKNVTSTDTKYFLVNGL